MLGVVPLWWELHKYANMWLYTQMPASLALYRAFFKNHFHNTVFYNAFHIPGVVASGFSQSRSRTAFDESKMTGILLWMNMMFGGAAYCVRIMKRGVLLAVMFFDPVESREECDGG